MISCFFFLLLDTSLYLYFCLLPLLLQFPLILNTITKIIIQSPCFFMSRWAFCPYATPACSFQQSSFQNLSITFNRSIFLTTCCVLFYVKPKISLYTVFLQFPYLSSRYKLSAVFYFSYLKITLHSLLGKFSISFKNFLCQKFLHARKYST